MPEKRNKTHVKKESEGDMLKNITILAVIALLIAGCSMITRLSPAKIPKELTTYTGKELKPKEWQSVGLLEDLKGEAIIKNIVTQLDCKAIMEKDAATFTVAIHQANINLEEARNEWNTAVGTVTNPGWLLSFLIGAGGLLGGRILTKLTHYSEEEVGKIRKENNVRS